jgi:hypothetical protein
VNPSVVRQPDRPDDPEGVLLEALPRLAHGPDQACLDVGPAAVQVDEPRRTAAGLGAPGQRVHREVAPAQVGLDRTRELDRGAVAGSRRSRGRSGTS